MPSKTKKSRAGRRAKHKGDQFERDLANALEQAYGNPKAELTERLFRRTPLSGGFKRDYPSDLIVPDWFPFCIEAKKRKSSALDLNLLPENGKKHALLVWFEQEQKKAWVGAQKTLLLIFERDYGTPLVMLDTKILEMLNNALSKGLSDSGGVAALRIRCNGVDVTVLTLDRFLVGVDRPHLDAVNLYLKDGVPQLKERAQAASVALSTLKGSGGLAGVAVKASVALVPPAGPSGPNGSPATPSGPA